MENDDKEIIENCVIIDSNFILLPYQFKVDYLTEIRLNLEGKIKFLIFKQVLNELDAKKMRFSNATKFHQEYKSGLLYLDKNKTQFNIIHVDDVKKEVETTDDFLLMHSIRFKKKCNHVFLATNDSLLRRKALKAGVNVIFLRQRKYICFERA